MPTAERHHLSGEEKLRFHNVKVVKSGDVYTFNAYLALEPWFDVGVVCFNAV